MALQDYFTTFLNKQAQAQTPPPVVAQPGQVDGNTQVQNSLEFFLNPNSEYIQNARQRGMEVAATRGGVNSSIAAGNAERAAMEAAMPLVQQAQAIETDREQLTAQAATQNWLNQQSFNREFQGQLAMLPVASSFNMLGAIQQFALQDPALYTPEVVSGYSNFFNQNMNDILSRYFGGA